MVFFESSFYYTPRTSRIRIVMATSKAFRKAINVATRVLPKRHPHLHTILRDAVDVFRDRSYRLRYSFAGTAIRELLREYLDFLAPDAEIKKTIWFKPDPSSKSGVTRKHRVQFAIYRYLEPKVFDKDLTDKVDAIAKDLGDVIGELSALTHITPRTLKTSRKKALVLFTRAMRLFSRLARAIAKARAFIHEKLEDELSLSLSHLFTEEFFDDIDVLSSHSRPTDAVCSTVKLVEITQDGVSFKGTGRVDVDLQYGSDGDCRRGDGLECSDSFPFRFSGKSSIEDPFEALVEASDVDVDTSSFYE